MASADSYLSSDLPNSWERCLLVWRERGRVEDLPKGVRRPRYTPDLGKSLGWGIVERFTDEYSFILGRLRSEDPVEVFCAFDVLEMIAERLMHRSTQEEGFVFPRELLEISIPLPAQALSEIQADHLYEGFNGRTIGEWFAWMKQDYDS